MTVLGGCGPLIISQEQGAVVDAGFPAGLAATGQLLRLDLAAATRAALPVPRNRQPAPANPSPSGRAEPMERTR